MAAIAAIAAAALLLHACPARVPAPEPLRVVETRPVERSAAEWVDELRFETAGRDTVVAFLRRPAPDPQAGVRPDAAPGPGAYGVVMVAGRETGRQAAAIIPPPLEGYVLALEYPGAIPDALEMGTLLRSLVPIRRIALRMPGIVRGAGHWLAARPGVDPARTLLVGVSFGVPFAAAAARDPVFTRVALLHGGADLPLLFRTHLPMESRLARRSAATAAAILFRDLEPARHVGRISPRPLLLINGLHDDLVPRESAVRIRDAAREPVRQIWLDHGHLMPWHLDVIREMADSTLAHFPGLWRPRPD
jgi:hypothetical protein